MGLFDVICQEAIFVGIKETVRKGLSSHGVVVTEDHREDTLLRDPHV